MVNVIKLTIQLPCEFCYMRSRIIMQWNHILAIDMRTTSFLKFLLHSFQFLDVGTCYDFRFIFVQFYKLQGYISSISICISISLVAIAISHFKKMKTVTLRQRMCIHSLDIQLLYCIIYDVVLKLCINYNVLLTFNFMSLKVLVK